MNGMKPWPINPGWDTPGAKAPPVNPGWGGGGGAPLDRDAFLQRLMAQKAHMAAQYAPAPVAPQVPPGFEGLHQQTGTGGAQYWTAGMRPGMPTGAPMQPGAPTGPAGYHQQVGTGGAPYWTAGVRPAGILAPSAPVNPEAAGRFRGLLGYGR